MIEARQDRLADPTVENPALPVLLAVSDNGPQMGGGRRSTPVGQAARRQAPPVDPTVTEPTSRTRMENNDRVLGHLTLGRVRRSLGRRLSQRVAGVLLAGVVAGGCSCSEDDGPATSADPAVGRARAEVDRAATSLAPHRGPQRGPTAQPPGLVVFVAADVTTGSIAGVARGANEAVRAIGWKLQIRGGQGSASGRRRALATALRQRPAGIILGGFDAAEHRATLREARRRGIPVVGWHAGVRSGPDRRRELFTNVTTEPAEVARLAASYVIADSNGRAGVLIVRDEQSALSRFKAQVMRSQLEQCQRCSVLNVLNIPIDSAVVGMPAAVSSFAVRYGERFRYLLADNGEYVTGARVGLIGLGRRGDEPPFSIAAGDGDASEFERIRARDHQEASVAEPLYLQGWQLIDELNRARARQPPSGYRAPPRLITRDDVPSGPVFDPASGYRQNYLLIWGR